MSPCRDALDARIDEINALMRAHAGGVELIDITADGTVSVRFAGKCTGCELRPLTMASTIRPGLLDVAGVKRVAIIGARISEEAEQRLAETFETERHASRLQRMFHHYRMQEHA